MNSPTLMMLNAPYPDDIRVRKEASALIAAGIEVHLLCLRKKNQAVKEEVDGIHVHRIDAGKNNYGLAFWDVVMSVTFVHPVFKKAASALLEGKGIKTIHVHDLPLAGTALAIRGQVPVRVIVDLHENYPEALKTWFKWKKNPLVRLKNYFFLNPDRWAKLEALACRQADTVIAVVEEMKDRLVRAYDIAPEKVKTVTNTEDKDFVKQSLDKNIYKDLVGKFILTYSGGIGPHRGVDVAIRAMKFLEEEPAIQLAIVGFGSPSVMDGLARLKTELKLTNVHFIGYQPFSKFYAYMHMADVNVIPHQSNGHTDNTVPHKLFQGMMAGKPLLVSSSAPLRRLVEKYNAGLVFTAGDPADFAKKVMQLFQDRTLREKLGANGIHATMEGELNWETTRESLIALYKNH